MQINDLLRVAVERKASDLHLKAGNHPVVRIDGDLVFLDQYPLLTGDLTTEMALSLMNPRQKERFKEELGVDLSYAVPGLGRFRCNAFHQRGTVSIVSRVIHSDVPALDDLNLPEVVKIIADEPRGLVLCTGTTGSGKSTTLAAMIDYINQGRSEHIVTVEDPIEFVHRDRKAVINQREIDVDAISFSHALRSAMRQDPDVILVGEMRDPETIETALLAAETGHLVLSTLHTLDAAETVHRIVTMFPIEQHQQIRIQLAQVLRAVISMRLIPKASGKGRVPAVEVMRATPYIRECIENPGKTKFISDQIARGTSQYHMQTFDQSLHQLYEDDHITLEEALRRASNADEFRLRLQGVQSTADMALEEMEETLGGVEPI